MASREDITRLLGPMDDHKAVEIIALEPSEEELEEVASYLAGMTDVMGKERHKLTGKTATIYEIVRRDELSKEDEYP